MEAASGFGENIRGFSVCSPLLCSVNYFCVPFARVLFLFLWRDDPSYKHCCYDAVHYVCLFMRDHIFVEITEMECMLYPAVITRKV